MISTSKSSDKVHWIPRELVKSQQARQKSEQQFRSTKNKINILQLQQLKLYDRIRRQQRSIEFMNHVHRANQEQEESRRQAQRRKEDEQKRVRETVQQRKQLMQEQRKHLITSFMRQKLQDSTKFKQANLELQKRIQQERESQQVKNIIKHTKVRRERAQSVQRAQRSKEILRVPYVDLSLLEMERINRTRTEQSIRQLEAQEQRLLSEYQSSLVLSQSLRKMLDPRNLRQVRTKSYNQ